MENKSVWMTGIVSIFQYLKIYCIALILYLSNSIRTSLTTYYRINALIYFVRISHGLQFPFKRFIMPTTSQSKSQCSSFTSRDFSPIEIRNQLQRVLNSAEFRATDAQRALLRYVIEKTLAGQAEDIKGYAVATDVFGRGDDFDQARDPIVSIQANKLRRALERYYLVEGHLEPICITIPKGAYVPVFESTNKQPAALGSHLPAPSQAADPWPTIVVQALENQTLDKNLEYLGIGIATEIALEITRYQEIRVLRHRVDGQQDQSIDNRARFLLDGSVRKAIDGLKVFVSLTDLVTGIQIWADSYRTDLNPTDLIAFEERVATISVGKIMCECGIITKTLSLESERIPPRKLKTHQAILRFYQFMADFSPQSFMETYEALNLVCLSEPECGLAWSMRARLYTINSSLELFDVPTSFEEALSFAQKGVQLEPANQRVRITSSFVLFLTNEIHAGLAELEESLRLSSKSLLFLDNIGYLAALLGDWERGTQLIRETIDQNPYYNTIVHHALFLDWIRKEKYDRALEETLHFTRPALFWDPLLKASAFGLLGRYEEGKQTAVDILKCKPDFISSGQTLIRYFIKEESLLAQIVYGLKKVGVDIA